MQLLWQEKREMRKKMKETNKIGYYSILPSTILFNKKLKANEKLLYAIITSLANKEGYCFASNKYLAELLDAQPHTISIWISNLKEMGFLNLQMIKDSENKCIQRRIFPNDSPYVMNMTSQEQGVTNMTSPISYSRQYNIINNNMIDRFFLYIINESEKVPEEFLNVDKIKIIQVLYKYEMFYNKEMLQYMQDKNLQKIKEITYAIGLMVKDNLQQVTYKITRDKLIQIYNECKTRELEYKGTNSEIEGFVNYYYKSIKNEMVKGTSQSFFMPKNELKIEKNCNQNNQDIEL